MSAHHTEKSTNSQSTKGPSATHMLARAGVFTIYKKAGETLAGLVARFRKEQSFDESLPITYAGRLDPMAEGLVILLTGEACKQKEEYLGLDKTYTFEVLFGVATDTFDMLGLITETKEMNPTAEQIEKAIEQVKRVTTFSYPPFSSKPVDGVPLFIHAKAGTLPDTLPTLNGKIYTSILQNTAIRPVKELVGNSIEIMQKVEGDFRQEEIIKGWEKFLENNKDKKCVVATFEATVSSGVYVRTIATLIGEALGGVALAYSIKRTKVGDFFL